MKRFVRLFAAAVLSFGAAISLATSAQAQDINCSAHVLDATAAQGVSTDQIERQIVLLQEEYPRAEVYAHAYEQLPGGTVTAFQAKAKQQCGNWFDTSGERLRDNVMVVVYGHDTDKVGVLYGYHFESVVTALELEYIMNGVNSSLGPDKSQVNPDYVTSAIKDALRSTEWQIDGYSNDRAKLYQKPLTPYDPPPFQDANDFHEDPHAGQLAAVIAAVIVGALALGVVFSAVGNFAKRVRSSR